MVSPEEIDDQLEPEVKDEMKKYGQVNKVLIYRVSRLRIHCFRYLCLPCF